MSPLSPWHSHSWLCSYAPRSPVPSQPKTDRDFNHKPPPLPQVIAPQLMIRRGTTPLGATRNDVFSVGKKIRRRQPDRDAVARQNVWQVLDQSPAAWRVNGGTGKNTNTNPSRCKAPRYR
jgi:hypothetical protein